MLPVRTSRLAWANPLRGLALSAIVILAAALRFANLQALGFANHYYTAGVASMLQSWHNFFYVAAEPGGAVSIDKPPLGLWLQAISAYFLGVNGTAMVLPEILCGLLSIVLLHYLVRRTFSVEAGLIAALAMAVTPVVVATDRNNTIDSSLIFTLLLATWAFIKATESGRLCYLLLGAVLVGLGFNIKMMQAYLPLPAFYALYFFGARVNLGRKILNLIVATVLLLAVSLSWAVAVDLTPAEQRPYVGSSGNNSVLNLMLGYNGLQRLTGMGGNFTGFLTRLRGGTTTLRNDGANQTADGNLPPRAQADGNGTQPGADGRINDGQPPQPPNGGTQGGAGGGGFPGTGQAGVWRLFTSPLSKEVSWLLPFGLFSIVLLLFRDRLRWTIEPKHQAVVLWGGWLLIGVMFFSVAGFFHEYYLSMLAAPLAALVGIGTMELWHLRERHRWWGLGLLAVTGLGTLAFQLYTAQSFVNMVWWLAISWIVFAVGMVVLVVARKNMRAVRLGFTVIILALFVTPSIWSALTTINTSGNQSLPSAYSGRVSGPANGGNVQVNQSLLNYLQANTQGMKYLMAVPSSMQGADYVLATGRPVLYLGGFSGQDEVVSSDELAQMVKEGELRYVYWGGQGGPGRNSQTISSWVSAHCKPLQNFNTVTRNAGAPDGTDGPNGTNGNNFPGGPNMQVSLYDCGR